VFYEALTPDTMLTWTRRQWLKIEKMNYFNVITPTHIGHGTHLRSEVSVLQSLF